MNIDKKSLVSSVSVAVVVALLTSFAVCKLGCSKSNIGVIDLQRVVSVSKDVAALRAARETQVAELQKMADAANAQIDQIKNEEEKKAATEKYLAGIRAKKVEFDNAYNTSLQASDKKIQGIIDTVAAKQKLKVVLNKTSVVTGGTDITEAVVDLVK